MASDRNRLNSAAATAITVVCVLAVIVAVSVFTNGGQPPTASPSPSQTPVEQSTVLVEDDFVRITYTGSGTVAGIDGTAYLYFGMDNLSAEELTVVPVDSYLDGVSVLLGSGVPATMAPGKSCTHAATAYYAAIGINSYDDLRELETCFDVVAADGSVVETVGPFTVPIIQEAAE